MFTSSEVLAAVTLDGLNFLGKPDVNMNLRALIKDSPEISLFSNTAFSPELFYKLPLSFLHLNSVKNKVKCAEVWILICHSYSW